MPKPIFTTLEKKRQRLPGGLKKALKANLDLGEHIEVFRSLTEGPDIRVHGSEPVAGQEPDPYSGDFATSYYVSFSISGKSLARLLGKQQRVVERALGKLTPKDALRALDRSKIADEVLKKLRTTIQGDLVHTAERNVKKLNLSWSDSDWGPTISKRINPEPMLTFKDIEVDAYGDWA